LACGPFFPDSVLDDPQAALDVPQVSYLHELRTLAGIEADVEIRGPSKLADQVPAEVEELVRTWKAAEVPEAEIKRRTALYKEVRLAQLGCFGEPGLTGFPVKEGAKTDLGERPLGDGFPKDVADYVEASRLLAAGDKDGARALWKEIVERPPGEKRLRGAWAAWMLAKTAPGSDLVSQWYRRVGREVEGGAGDVLGLHGAALAWLATMEKDPLEAIRLGFKAFKLGHDRAAVDLRHRCGRLVGMEDAELLSKAANDDLVRRLINIDVFALLDGPSYGPIDAGENPWPPDGWFEALEKRSTEPDPDAARVAWALYSTGRFDRAKRWLGLVPGDDARAAWLRGKLALRDGNLDEAADALAEAVKLSKQANDWSPRNLSYDPRWFDDGDLRTKISQGRLLADFGVVSMATKDYGQALNALVEGGYWEDAAYVAERVMTAKELVAHMRKFAPEWSKELSDYWAGEPTDGYASYPGPVDPAKCFDLTTRSFDSWSVFQGDFRDQLRYVLARRLAREWSFDAAREWMPEMWVPLFDHYVALHRARRSGKYTGGTYAAITWRQAWIHRHYGAEMFGTESAPDGGARNWSFPMPDLGETRARFADRQNKRKSTNPESTDAKPDPDPVIPPVADDEIRRASAAKPLADDSHRFHYRYTAAGIAWKAAAALPGNHPMLAPIYNSAGCWLAGRDPKAADRFYQALVRRCPATDAGRRADEKRWFLDDLPELGEWGELPDGLGKE
jgi:tetratricopeptide (TPR) repeat protein